jgi:L-ascorbate metabolism protein UlaG (beta-lactamase superfamily)
MRVTWLGHATALIEAGGARLLTDPMLRSRVGHIRRHAPPVRHPGRVDAVLLSHLHHDHLDVPSLRKVDAPVLGPRGTARALRSLPVDVEEIAAGDERPVGGARVRAVHAEHDGRRWPFQERRDDDAIGFVVSGDGRTAYFAGDTEVFAGMAELGAPDLALVPIWGWGPVAGPGHMDPKEAAEALALLRPRLAIPIHWGTYLRYGLEKRLLRDPVEAFLREAAAQAPEARIEVLEPGDTFDLD